jgi:hypothetical protein
MFSLLKSASFSENLHHLLHSVQLLENLFFDDSVEPFFDTNDLIFIDSWLMQLPSLVHFEIEIIGHPWLNLLKNSLEYNLQIALHQSYSTLENIKDQFDVLFQYIKQTEARFKNLGNSKSKVAHVVESVRCIGCQFDNFEKVKTRISPSVLCEGCQCARYCSKECLASHAVTHNPVCLTIAPETTGHRQRHRQKTVGHLEDTIQLPATLLHLVYDYLFPFF